MTLLELRPALSLAELPSLEWTEEQRYSAYGAHFGLRTNHPKGLTLARPYLPFGWQATKSEGIDLLYSLTLASPHERDSARKCHRLYADAELIAESDNIEEILQTLAQHAELATLWRAQDYLFVHAGVVGWKGRAILVPGRSFAGKTTLVRELVRAGATYYSDEYALLDNRGWVYPYSVPLSIRAANAQPTKIPIEQLGGQRGTEPLPVGLIVATHYQHHARWRPQTLSPSHAMLVLMENTVAARREPEYTMPILRETALHATTVQSKRGEARALAAAILELASR